MQKVLLLRGSLALCPFVLCPLSLLSLSLLSLSLFSFALCPLSLRLFALCPFALCPFAFAFYSFTFRPFYTKATEMELSPDSDNACLPFLLARRRASTFTARSKSSITFVNSLSTSSIISRLVGPPVLATIISTCQIQKGLPTASDIVARESRGPVHHLECLRDNLLQKIRLFTNYFTRDLIRKQQDALEPIGKAQQHLVVFVLFLQKLHGLELPLLLTRQ